MDKLKGASVGNIIECEGGYAVFPNYSSCIVYDKQGVEMKRFSGDADHYANFIKAVKSRRYQDLNADILEGHLSSALCHTGNISYQLGKKQSPEEIQEQIKASASATESYERMLAHLEANNIDLVKTPLTMGVMLKMDPQTERFVNNDAANKMLTRDYRKPYVVPEKV